MLRVTSKDPAKPHPAFIQRDNDCLPKSRIVASFVCSLTKRNMSHLITLLSDYLQSKLLRKANKIAESLLFRLLVKHITIIITSFDQNTSGWIRNFPLKISHLHHQ